MTTNNETPLLARIRAMQVGENITVPVNAYAYNTVRRYASDCNFLMERNYSVHMDRKARTFTVTRNS